MMKPLYIFLLILLIPGCKPFQILEPVDLGSNTEYPRNNYLVISMSRLNIPEGWRFRRPTKEVKKSEVISELRFFEFDDTTDTIAGYFEYSTFNDVTNVSFKHELFDVKTDSIIPLGLAENFAEDWSSEYKNKTVHKTTINQHEAFIIEGVHKEKNRDMITALLPEGRNFNEIQIVSDSGWIKSHRSIPHQILSSYRLETKKHNERFIKDLVHFKCTDGSWYWKDDWNVEGVRGYSIIDSSDFETPVEYISIAVTASDTARGLEPLFTMYEEIVIIPDFEVTISLGKKKYKGEAIVTKNRSRDISAYYIVKHGGLNHLIMVVYKQGAVSIEPGKLHLEWDAIKNVMDNYLSLN